MSLVIDGKDGTITVPDGVLVGIAVRGAENVDGVRVRRRRTIDVEQRLVRLSVSARRGEPLVDLAKRAQDEIASALEAMCGLTVSVEISIGELE